MVSRVFHLYLFYFLEISNPEELFSKIEQSRTGQNNTRKKIEFNALAHILI